MDLSVNSQSAPEYDDWGNNPYNGIRSFDTIRVSDGQGTVLDETTYSDNLTGNTVPVTLSTPGLRR